MTLHLHLTPIVKNITSWCYQCEWLSSLKNSSPIFLSFTPNFYLRQQKVSITAFTSKVRSTCIWYYLLNLPQYSLFTTLTSLTFFKEIFIKMQGFFFRLSGSSNNTSKTSSILVIHGRQSGSCCPHQFTFFVSCWWGWPLSRLGDRWSRGQKVHTLVFWKFVLSQSLKKF